MLSTSFRDADFANMLVNYADNCDALFLAAKKIDIKGKAI